MTDVVTRLHAERGELSISGLGLPDRLARRLHDADVGNEQLVGAAVWLVGGVVVAGLAFAFLGIWTGVSALAVVVSMPIVLLAKWSGRRNERTIEALPLLVEAMARSLRSGASFALALSEVAHDAEPPLRHDVQAVLLDIGRGRSASSALRAWSTRAQLAEVRIVAAALAFATRHESGASMSLQGVAQTLRDRASVRAEIQSLTAQAASSMQALVLLPIAFLVLDALSGRSALGFLTGHPLGRLCLLLGVLLDVAGFVWMRSIVRRVMP